jgi:hypothetical protein
MRRACWLAAAAVLLAGCGGHKSNDNGIESKSIPEIVSAVKTAAKGASSVHLAGTVNDSGKSLRLDLHLVAGKGGQGTMAENGFTVQIVRIGDKAYFKGDKAFWSHFGGAAAAALFDGKWIEAPANGSSQLAGLTPLTNLTAFFNAVFAGPNDKLKKGTTATVDGQPAFSIIDPTSDGGTLYVATTGEPLPLKLVGPKSDSGSITFSEWNQPVTLTAPKGALDYTKLKAAVGG